VASFAGAWEYLRLRSNHVMRRESAFFLHPQVTGCYSTQTQQFPHPGIVSLALIMSHRRITNHGWVELINERMARRISSPSPLVSHASKYVLHSSLHYQFGKYSATRPGEGSQALKFPVPDNACHRLKESRHDWRYNWTWNDTRNRFESRSAAPNL
jgi:hypothetical protein